MMINKQDWPALITGMMATLAGIGMARFAYTPLLPALVEANWFSASQGAYLGAANLLGYFIGALAAHPLSERFSAPRVMIISFAIIALSFLLCALEGSFAWFFVWRLLSGIAGALLMVIGPSMALAATPLHQRAKVATLAFTGIGLGALLSASLVPLLLKVSLTATWSLLGLVCILIALVGHWGLGRLALPQAAPSAAGQNEWHLPVKGIIFCVLAAYALDAVGFVPHTVFWVDYLAREQGFGQAAASLQWGLFGLGAVLGPLMVSLITRQLGWHRALILAFSIKALAVALPAFSLSLLSQSLSSFFVGALVPGIVALTSGRLAELVGPQAHKKVWGLATAAFAAAQAASGYSLSALYTSWGSYSPLFILGSLSLLVGLAFILMSARAAAGYPRANSTPKE